MLTRFTTKVVGVSYVPGYPQNLLTLLRTTTDLINGWRDVPPPKLILMAEANEYDDMAVMVVVDRTTVRDLPLVHYQVGYLGGGVAARVRPDLEEWDVESWEINVIPSLPHQPGISVALVRKP